MVFDLPFVTLAERVATLLSDCLPWEIRRRWSRAGGKMATSTKSLGWMHLFVVLAMEASSVSGYTTHPDPALLPSTRMRFGTPESSLASSLASNVHPVQSNSGSIIQPAVRPVSKYQPSGSRVQPLIPSGSIIQPSHSRSSSSSSKYSAVSRFWETQKNARPWMIFKKIHDLRPGSGMRWRFLGWLNSTGRGKTLNSPSARIRIPLNSPLALHAGAEVGQPRWGYTHEDGPYTWLANYPQCNGVRQSPINIQTSRMRFKSMEPMHMINFRPQSGGFKVSYDGAAVKLSPKTDIYFTGLGLSRETYTLSNIHFHWSSHDTHGSEHAIDGVRFPMEMHVLCYVTKHGSLESAMRKKDGLAAIAVIWDIGKTNNALWPILSRVTGLTRAGEEVPLPAFDLRGLFPDTPRPFFRYKGSVTTPPCTENVIWTVCEHVQTLSNEQFQMFQGLRQGLLATGGTIETNSRPLQPANNIRVASNNPIFPR